MIKTAIVFNHRKRLNADMTAPVEIRVMLGRKPYYINTGVCVRVRDFKFGQIINRHDCTELNERLSIMIKKVDEIINEYIEQGQPLNIIDVRKRLWAPDARKKIKDASDMLLWMEQEIDKLGVSKGTASHYRCTLTALTEFGLMRKWSDLSVEHIHRFDAYLHAIKKHQTDAEIKAKKPVEYISQATVRNYHKDFKALLARALKFGLINANPYDRMKGEIKRGDNERVEFLTKDELSRIESLTLADGSMIAAARDMFIFQSYTGMSYSDMQSFTLAKCRCENGKYILSDKRVKTGVSYYVQLLPPALAVVRKYGGQLPQITNQSYNKNLKKIAEATGITKRLTSHVGRHTFATWALHNGVQLERVSKMLGHSKITQTQRYAKVLAADVYEEFDKLEQKQKERQP